MSIPNANTQHLPQRSNAFKALLFIAILSLNLVLMSKITMPNSVEAAPILFIGLGILLLATINAVAILGMAVLAHEAVHNVLFRSRLLNDAVGGLLSAMSLIPFYANRQFHLSHHSYAHQEGNDPECTMHGKGFLYAFFIGPHIGIFLQHRKFLANFFRGFKQAKYLRRFFLDALFLHIALLYYTSLVIIANVSILFALLPTALMFTVVFSYRALSDHYGLPKAKRKSEIRKEIGDQAELEKEGYEIKQASGWVVISHPIVRWVWSNVNYHEVHHKYPYLSHIHLPHVYEETKGAYEYAVAKSFGGNLLKLRKQAYFGEPLTDEPTENQSIKQDSCPQGASGYNQSPSIQS